MLSTLPSTCNSAKAWFSVSECTLSALVIWTIYATPLVEGAAEMVTSSAEPGTAPVDQSVAVVHRPLVPVFQLMAVMFIPPAGGPNATGNPLRFCNSYDYKVNAVCRYNFDCLGWL